MKLEDRFGRVATDLRVSLTDRCNLRCTYCMPAEGLDWLPDESVLTDDEIVRLIGVGITQLGIEEVRFTGGEPLVRRGLVGIVAGVRSLNADVEMSLTTNALGLSRQAGALAEAGLNRVNVSLDSIRHEAFREITRRDRLHDVLEGLQAAHAAGLGPVKVNAVLMRGINDDQAPELLQWAIDHGYELRFIEQMPLDAQHQWNRTNMITADEIFERLSTEFTLTPHGEPRGSAPAELFDVDGGPATVGVIASVTRPFCGDCDRVRLTADGQIRNCLFAREESDLRTALRSGATDLELAERWVIAMRGKRAGHGIDDPSFLQPDRPMSAIGG
ncbi:MAG: GTP 3',8-cyclase MoaA [Nocardioides sp.]